MSRLLTAMTVGAMLVGGAAAQATSSSAAGVVTKMNIDDLKAVFNDAGVAFTVMQDNDGLPYLRAEPEGYLMFVSLVDCPTKGVAVDCLTVVIESGTWARKLTEADVNAYNRSYRYVRAVIHDPAKGDPGLIQSFSIAEGVSQGYLRGQLRTFVRYMKEFGAFEWLPSQAAAGSSGPSSSSGFSATPQLPTLGEPDITLRNAGSGAQN